MISYLKNILKLISYILLKPIYRINKYRSRYIICSPRGGLNDTLNQIERCRRLCVISNRTLILYTEESGLMNPFFNIFMTTNSFKVRCISFSKSDFLIKPQESNDLKIAKKLISHNHATWTRNNFHFKNGIQSRVIAKDALGPEKFLLDIQCGGGIDSFSILKHLKFTSRFKKIINNEIAKLPHYYFAIHIRNTDMKTNYQEFVQTIKDKVADKTLVICTDDQKVAEFILSEMPNTNIITTPTLERAEGYPLHKTYHSGIKLIESKAEMFTSIRDTLIDLSILAMSDKLFFTKNCNGNFSGFSLLANYLHSNPKLMDKLGIKRSKS